MRLIDFRILLCLMMLVSISGAYLYVDGQARADIFLFYDYVNLHTGVKGRLVVNILNDLAHLITIFTLLFLWHRTVSYRSLKRVLLPFVIIAGFDLVDYLLFFQQNAVFKLPLLIGLIIWFNLNFKRFFNK